MGITLFSQPNCPFCDIMKDMLDRTGYTYYTANISENAEAKQFLKENNHRTVPQLYVNNTHINTKPDTRDYTSEELAELIGAALDQSDWPWADSGIEQGI